ncbi:MAG TPA: gamma-glutamyl-gamma-aminobutyrate hydrolase family protein [Polyangiaceae bacterium]|nr:gamma-glutamyl-gamma-aminobutyrate hydrolase family protein [Polyangiaceae bacterium]
MSRSVLVLQHAPWETPALIETALGGLPIQRRIVLEERSPELPPVSQLLGLVVMGGPQDANDDQRYPGLSAERRLLAEAVSADVPVLGVCLGMQLLGLALGATLHLQHGKEIGFAPVTLTEAGARDPVLGAFAAPSPSAGSPVFLHWHSDAVELPRGAELLASTAVTPVQSFRIGSALGTQFHPEADAALLESWLGTPAMTDSLPAGLVGRIRADAATHLPGLRTAALAGFASFADSVRRR